MIALGDMHIPFQNIAIKAFTKNSIHQVPLTFNSSQIHFDLCIGKSN